MSLPLAGHHTDGDDQDHRQSRSCKKEKLLKCNKIFDGFIIVSKYRVCSIWGKAFLRDVQTSRRATASIEGGRTALSGRGKENKQMARQLTGLLSLFRMSAGAARKIIGRSMCCGDIKAERRV